MKRVIVPIVLILLGATLMIGCFYLPAPHPTETSAQKKLYDSIGGSNSKRPMRVGQVTRAQVLHLAPEPEWASRDGKSLAYSIAGVDGYWVLPLCFRAAPATDVFGIRLNFDNGGILRSYKFFRGSDMDENVRDLTAPFYYRGGSDWPPPLPSTTQRSNAAVRNP